MVCFYETKKQQTCKCTTRNQEEQQQELLTHWCLVTRHGDIYRGNIGSDNGLVPDSTKPLSKPTYNYIGSDNGLLPDSIKPLLEPMLTYISSKVFSGIHMRAISQKTLMISISKKDLKITVFKLLPLYPKGQWTINVCWGILLHNLWLW